MSPYKRKMESLSMRMQLHPKKKQQNSLPREGRVKERENRMFLSHRRSTPTSMELTILTSPPLRVRDTTKTLRLIFLSLRMIKYLYPGEMNALQEDA